MAARSGFNARKECEKLVAAMKSMWNVDTKAISDCLTSCSNAQRQQIAAHYMREHKTSLVEELKRTLASSLERLMLALVREPFRFLSIELNDAITERNEEILIEILCTKNVAEIKQIKEAYRRGEVKFQTTLSHTN